MKVRSGFVSNSSSSSFILALKKEISNDKLMEIFKIPADSPISGIGREIMEIYKKNAEKLDDFTEWYIDQYGNDKSSLEDKEVKKIKSLFEKGYAVYKGDLSSEEGGLESYLCDTDLMYESEDLVIYHEGGY